MNESMPQLVRTIMDLCRLRRGPQDLPYSPNLLVTLVVVTSGLVLLVGEINGNAVTSVLDSLLSNAIVLGLCWVALAIRNLRARYVQTATALMACGLLLLLIQIPFTLLGGPPPDAHAPLTGMQWLVSWVSLALFAWEISVDAHIMRHALGSSFAFAFLLVVSWVLVYWALAGVLFPQPAQP